ncbi:MAG: putative membrane protein YeaQ/YmgE (transglycosylase-associated protein family) [Bradyrhizobium sp.]|jgi:uncharacterized membrane protein YeaQ/YmgE (transglycosylase-associated protein family)
MNFIIWIIAGGIAGWLAGIIMKTNEQQGTLLNVVAGVAGAVIGGGLIAPLFGSLTINQSDLSISALFISLLGALILLTVVHLLWREKSR